MCVTPTVQPPKPPQSSQRPLGQGPGSCLLQEETHPGRGCTPTGDQVGSFLTSRDPVHPENALNGYLHHRLHHESTQDAMIGRKTQRWEYIQWLLASPAKQRVQEQKSEMWHACGYVTG